MDAESTEQQSLLRDTVRRRLRTSEANSDTNGAHTLWRDLAEKLGILGLLVPVDSGGLGRSVADMMIVMEELGSALVDVPFLETSVMAPFLLASSDSHAELREQIISGEARLAIAWGELDSNPDPMTSTTAATRKADEWHLEGSKSVVMGAQDATQLVVVAQTDNEPCLFLVPRGHAGVTLKPFPTVDGRSAADIDFDVTLPASALICRGENAVVAIETGFNWGLVALGAELVGVMERLLDETIEYTRERSQFGQPIAQFQALQHRMVDMYTNLELSRSAVQRAASSIEHAPSSRTKALAAMKVTIGASSTFIAQNAVQLHGGMGMTDELVIGKLFKRVLAINAEFGTPSQHLTQFPLLDDYALEAGFSDGDQAFDAEVREFFASEYPAHILDKNSKGLRLTKDDHIESQRALNSKGWFAGPWPKEVGGAGWTATEKFIFANALDEARAPVVIPMAITYIGPIVAHFGTDEQKERWLPEIMDSKAFWAQGYSEPDSGSDLASLSLDGQRDGDHYVLNGTKTWTSGAHWADWIFCLVRTSRHDRKQAGISMICVPMDAEGVTVTPIITMDGSHELNQVFFDDVRTEATNLIGEEGEGWHYANVLLGNERLSYAHIGRKKIILKGIRDQAGSNADRNGQTMLDNPDFANRLAKLEIRLSTIESFVFRVLNSDPEPAAISALKILCTEIIQDITELGLEVAGRYAVAYPNRRSMDDLSALPESWQFAPSWTGSYMFTRAQTIYGGSTEVQKNIIWRSLGRRQR